MTNLNFEVQKVQSIDLATLERTYKENDVFGKPLKEIYHYQLINEVLQRCKNYGLTYEIDDIFAANNNSKQYPGVSILPQVASQYGENAPEAHILRRVYSTIKIHDGETDELTTNIAIAYHQEGIQIAFGSTVKICRNLCILGSEKTVSNYGKDKISNAELLSSLDCWLANFGNYQERDTRVIEKMRSIKCDKADVLRLIGFLTSIRVAFDNQIGNVKDKLKTYPLNQAQISIFTENYLRFEEVQKNVSLWDVYNLATDIYHPNKTEIPNILPQTAVWFDVLDDMYKLN